VDPEDLDLPEYDDMSEQLKLRIRKSFDKNFVWLECKGRNPADRSPHIFSCGSGSTYQSSLKIRILIFKNKPVL
jgi:hypothetical protein